jgi:hypothetical protein
VNTAVKIEKYQTMVKPAVMFGVKYGAVVEIDWVHGREKYLERYMDR